MGKYEVCPRCDGEGKYVNLAIDGNGLTGEDIDRLGGEDFLEDYMGGVYDVRCDVCEGRRVVTTEDLEQWKDDAEDRAMIAAEMRMMGDY